VLATANGEATTAVAMSALVVFLIPATAVIGAFLIVRNRAGRIRRVGVAPPVVESSLPRAIAAELESRADAIANQAMSMHDKDFRALPSAVTNIATEASALRTVARNLLVLDRLETGRLIGQVDSTDLSGMISRITAQADMVGLDIGIIEEDVRVLADPA
jgi:hypothetical protein